MSPSGVPSVLFIVGPTATGKSTLAARFAADCRGEVLSADSVQVYRHFDVGSGKPSAEERALAPHHLIDIADPLQPIEASVWASLAASKITEVCARGALPVVCGGTFLWVRALLFGLAEAPPGDAQIRKRHGELSEAEGRQRLHADLATVDPESAARLHKNDFVRVSRALEVYELTGRRLSEIQREHGFRNPRYHAHLVQLDWDRPSYERRLEDRVAQMLARGFREEVSSLVERGYGAARAMDAVGYRQVKMAREGGPGACSDEELRAEIVRATRVFARRQRTWLREEAVEHVPASVLSIDSEFREWSRSARALLQSK